ncbi:MAG: hypothetical protein CH6_0505 [Candidatus Kapaibacterium sp.]|nr:MAG: hypothetical protein CH6_0505 [Candidatus Kapabacteria bacterium]
MKIVASILNGVMNYVKNNFPLAFLIFFCLFCNLILCKSK